MSGKENNVSDPLSDPLSKTQPQEDASKSNNAPSIVDMLSRTKTKEEIANQKKARAQSIAKVKSSEPEQPSAQPIAQPVTQSLEKPAEKPVEKPVEAQASRGRDPSESATTSSVKPTPTATTTVAKSASTKPKHPDDDRPSMALAPKSTRVQERDISPGTLPDGSHVKCSGEKGESYTPPTGLGGKIGGKLRGLGH